MSRASLRLYSEKLELRRGGASEDESDDMCRDMDADRIEGSSTVLARRRKWPGGALPAEEEEAVAVVEVVWWWPKLMPEVAAWPGRAEEEDAVEA
jgi:hypothetical protein